jgi:hypothetical protein
MLLIWYYFCINYIQKKEEGKMKKLIVLFSVCLLLFGMVGVAGAYSINYLFGTNGNEFISPYPGVTTETFNSYPALDQAWTWTGNFQVLTGSVVNVASAPFGVIAKDASYYVAVPQNVLSIPQSVTVTNLGGLYNYFGLWWGSLDTYNTLSFYNAGVLVASFTGTDIATPNPANGNQILPSTNLYVNFLDLPEFDSFMMTSTNYAFEADNFSIKEVAAVPEPITMLLLGSGLLGLWGFGRKFKK